MAVPSRRDTSPRGRSLSDDNIYYQRDVIKKQEPALLKDGKVSTRIWRRGFVAEDEESFSDIRGRQSVQAGTGYTTGREAYPTASHAHSQPAKNALSDVSGLEWIRDPYARSFFAKLLCNTPCAFLCSGQPEKCQIRQVSFREEDDDATKLGKLKAAWEEIEICLPFRKIAKVEEVLLRFSGVKSSESEPVYIGAYEQLDLDDMRHTLERQLEATEKSIHDFLTEELVMSCYEDNATGEWQHPHSCPVWLNGFTCDFVDRHKVEGCLNRLSSLPMLTTAFQDPLLASGQRPLEGLAQESGVYSHRDMLACLYRHNPRIGEIPFRGYKVTEEWEDIRHSMVVPSAATLLIGSSFLFRLIFGDWQTALGASSLVVALMALVIQWMIYFAGKS